MNPVERSRDLNRNNIDAAIFKYLAVDSIACVILGLGLYAKFAAQGNAFHPLLNNPNIVNGLLVVGGITLAASGIKLVSLMQQKARLKTSD